MPTPNMPPSNIPKHLEWRLNPKPVTSHAVRRKSALTDLETLNRQISQTINRTNRPEFIAPTDSEDAFIDESSVDDFEERIPELAMQFPFELDPFQKRAILHVEQQNNIFVAAHTSAGKTVVAEYAIALAAESGTKVFYTSPIKTLSNQKYRDFRSKFDSVGLVTGDVSINDDAQCIIMTTEILRSMLYKGDDSIRDLSYVVFDEVQFLNDKERGVVWEESIIMLPEDVTIIMLSATVPNALQFANWVGRTKGRPVAVVSTDKRPVPLQHALLHKVTGQESLDRALLIDRFGNFDQNALSSAASNMRKQNNMERDRKATEKAGRKKKKAKARAALKWDTARMPVESVAKPVVEQIDVDDPHLHVPDVTDNTNVAIVDEKAQQEAAEQPSELAHSNDVDQDDSDEAISEPDVAATVQTEKSPKPEKKETRNTGNRNKGPGRNAAKAINAATGKAPGKGPNAAKSPWAHLASYLDDQKQVPAVVFVFSKKRCETAVSSLENIDLLPDSTDKATVKRFITSAIQRLNEEDRKLPQVQMCEQNLQRGLAAHHAGLLPVVKEVTEILFSKGLVKLLFATETFAMGVNMPARTVVFSSIRKPDGHNFRILQAGEYTQMSGRAGRRGIDDVGHVYLYFGAETRKPNLHDLREIMTGKPITLKSAFRLTYNMILNVLRVDELEVEDMMERSFCEAEGKTASDNITMLLAKASKMIPDTVQSDTDAVDSPHAPLRDYVDKVFQLTEMTNSMIPQDVNLILRTTIVPGRLVVMERRPGQLMLAVIFSIVPHGRNSGKSQPRQTSVHRDTQLWVAGLASIIEGKKSIKTPSMIFLPESVDRDMLQFSNGRDEVSLLKHGGLHVSLQRTKARKIVYICNAIDEQMDGHRAQEQARAARSWHFSKRVPEALKYLSINAEYLKKVVFEWSKNGHEAVFEQQMQEVSHAKPSKGQNQRAIRFSDRYKSRAKLCKEMLLCKDLYKCIVGASTRGLLEQIEERLLQADLRKKIAALKATQENENQSSLLPEYENRVMALQKLDYVGDDGTSVMLKGRCGSEVTTANSMVLTEIVFESVLHGLEPAEVASLLSSLVCRRKNRAKMHDGDDAKYSEQYIEAKRKMRKVVAQVGDVQEKCKVELAFEITDDADCYEASVCRWDLSEAVYIWAKGEPFYNLTTTTEQQAGDIVVCMKRLCELLKDTQKVARGIGNHELCEVVEEAVTAIRRDVVFNASLYLDEDGLF